MTSGVSTGGGHREENWDLGAIPRPAVAAVAVALSVLAAQGAARNGLPRHLIAAKAQLSATAKVLAFDKTAVRPKKTYRIAYLAECTDNGYCQARLAGVRAAAKKYGFAFKLFDANFSPQTQLGEVQDAVAEGFNGYLLAPTAGAQACAMWKNYLRPTGKPVVTLDLPMCGDPNYTPGLAATVTMARQSFFDADVDYAFSSCKRRCQVAAIGGSVGSDLFTEWERAIAQGVAKYPNVKVVSNQPANFDPTTALQDIGDALRANPNLSVVISPWDDMTVGAEQAIIDAGKKPGKDVRIYSTGATTVGIKRVEQGAWNETMIFLPYQESYYAAVAMIMALEGKPVDAYVNEAEMPPVTKLGTLFVTKHNAAKYHPNYS